MAPVFDRLNERLSQHARFVAAARFVLVSVALMTLLSNEEANPVAIICVAGYVVVLLASRRGNSTTLHRLILVADVVYIPAIVAAHLPAGLPMLVLTIVVGSWITVCALDGRPRKTNVRIVAYAAFALLAVTSFEASAIDAILAAILAFLAYKTAGVQQLRLVGRTITSVERIQQTLALRPRQVETSPPAS